MKNSYKKSPTFIQTMIFVVFIPYLDWYEVIFLLYIILINLTKHFNFYIPILITHKMEILFGRDHNKYMEADCVIEWIYQHQKII